MCWLWCTSCCKNDFKSFKEDDHAVVAVLQVVWKFLLLFTHILLGQILLFIQHFECAGATLSGVEAAYKSYEKTRKITRR